MKKFARRSLVTLSVVGAVVAAGLIATMAVHAVATQVESGKIERYGQTVTVDGRQMNVFIAGDGPETIVLLPGFGTASPVLDFAPVSAELARDHRVVVVEPFGYGLSDGTDSERTTANIVTEVHAALQALEVDRYVLMGHSIAGIYGIEFATRFPEEVTAFVGIDTSVPGQPNMDTEFPTGLLAAAKNLGLLRLVAAMDGGNNSDAYSEHAQEQINMITNRSSLNPTYLNEMSHIPTNFRRALDTDFPADLPLLLFAVADNQANPDWLALHERQAAAVDDGTVIPVPGEHYLHHTHSAEIVDGYRAWADARRTPVG